MQQQVSAPVFGHKSVLINILSVFINSGQKLTIFGAINVENDIIEHFTPFPQHSVLLSPKKT